MEFVRIIVSLLLVMTALAGCAESNTPVPPDPCAEADCGQATDTTGVLRGVVIDASIVPIAGAKVTLLSSGQTATSNEEGIWFFDELEPGTYFFEATKIGFNSVQGSGDVKAGEATPLLKVQLSALPGSEPRAVTFEDVGYITCGWGVPVTYDYCGDVIGGEDDYRLQYEVSGMPDYIQVEVVWQSTQALSENLYMINAVCPAAEKAGCPGSTPFPDEAPYRWDEGTWTSPAIMRTPEGFLQQVIDHHGHEDMDGYWVGVDVSADGPALATGATLEQEFRGYVTMFWNLDPLEDWTFYEDGPYPVPE